MYKFLLVFALFSLLLCNILKAQSDSSNLKIPSGGTISGSVIDKQSSQPLEGAVIQVYTLKDSTMIKGGEADPGGNFTITGIPFGTYKVEVSFIGYSSLIVKPVTISQQKPDFVLETVKLKQSSATTDVIEVESERSTIEFLPDKKVFNVGNDVINNGGSATDVLKVVPSVSVDADGNVSLRGSSDVKILIDGKPSGLEGQSRSEILEQIPANMIESVELITNPGAKYEAESSSGIINIVLKKNVSSIGYNSNFTLGTGTKDKYNSSVGLSLKNDKFSAYANYNFRQFAFGMTGNSARQDFFNNTSLTQNSLTKMQRMGHLVKAGFDYTIDPKNTIGFTTTYSYRKRARGGITTSDDFNSSGLLTDYLTNNNVENETGYGLDLGLNYNGFFKSPENTLSGAITYSRTKEDNIDDYSNRQYYPDGSPFSNNPGLQNSTTNSLMNNFQVQLDYVLPIGKTTANNNGNNKLKGNKNNWNKSNNKNGDNDLNINKGNSSDSNKINRRNRGNDNDTNQIGRHNNRNNGDSTNTVWHNRGNDNDTNQTGRHHHKNDDDSTNTVWHNRKNSNDSGKVDQNNNRNNNAINNANQNNNDNNQGNYHGNWGNKDNSKDNSGSNPKNVKPGSKLEAGLKSIYRSTDNNYVNNYFDTTQNQWLYNSFLSNHFKYSEQIYAGYLTFSSKIKDFGFLAGTRVEETVANGNLITTGNTFKKNYIGFFPNLSVSQKFGETNEIQAIYARKISRPHLDDLNPFVDVSDPFNTSVGNPNLQPEYVDSYELNYLKYLNTTTIEASAFLKYTHDKIVRSRFLTDSGVTVTTEENLSSAKSYGLELIAISQVTPWLSINGSASYFRSQYAGQLSFGSVNNSNYSWNGKISANIRMWGGVNLQLLYNYQGEFVTAQGTIQPMQTFDFGVKKDFLDNKATIGFRVSDLFNTQKFNTSTSGNGFSQTNYRKRDSRVAFLTLSYRFGNIDYKMKQKRKKEDDNNNEPPPDEEGN
jgi:outer membrane receptor protein involved in Fe transport